MGGGVEEAERAVRALWAERPLRAERAEEAMGSR